ncbi:MAG: alpha/beta hydrolase, partial [Bdellovibrionales bacterium]|nr:alpha/beta hydrolase [Bdellovibrionales bacterium]
AYWGSSENVLFIHGNLASSEWWFPTMEHLQLLSPMESSPQGCLITADWRGYGESKGLKDPTEIDFERYAQDYIELIESLKLKKVQVVGHSTGGLIAMMAILKKPELFKSLVLLDSVGATGLELEFPLEQVLNHFELMSNNKDYCKPVLAATIERVDPESPQFQNLFEVTWNCDRVNWRSVPEILSTKIDISNRMPELKLPTLILHGELDKVLPLKGSEKLKQQIPQAELKVVEKHGHSYNMEDPHAFSKELVRFFGMRS